MEMSERRSSVRAFFFKALLAAAVGALLLWLVPQAQALPSLAPTAPSPSDPCGGRDAAFCLDKTASPTTVGVGQLLTFTITGHCAPNAVCAALGPSTIDTLPPGVQFVSADATGLRPASCTESAGTVTCGPETYCGGGFSCPGGEIPFVEHIVVRATQCGGPFTNTATDPFAGAAATASFTVVGCPTSQSPPQPHQQQHQHQQPVCPPASQEVANESESGNVSPSFGVTGSGDSSNQTAAPLQFGNTGNDNNAQGVLQTCGSQSGNVELEGGGMNFSPTLDTSSNQGVGQSSGSSGQ